MPKDDLLRLQHMLGAARQAQSFVEGRSRLDLDNDRMLMYALLKCIEIIGEAAAQTAPEVRERHLDIPWADIIGMRNRLIHAYHDIDLDRLWDTIVDDLPPLIAQLEAILPEP